MMNGVSLVISKPYCPMYNFGTISNIKYCTSNHKTDLIPCQLSNLLHQRIFPSIAIKPMVKLKHGVYSSHAGKGLMDSRFEAPELVSSTDLVPYDLLGLGIIGMTLPKAWEVVVKEGLLKLCDSYYYCILLAVGASLALKGFLGEIICGFAVLYHKPFSTGDIIEVGYLKGQVIEMGLITTSLLTVASHPIVIPTSWFARKVILNISHGTTLVPYEFLGDRVSIKSFITTLERFYVMIKSFLWEILKKTPVAPFHEMISKIYLVYEDNIKEIYEISEEITKMMISNPNAYLEKRTPSCRMEICKPYCELTLTCHLKQMSEDELYLVKQVILLLSAHIIKKHGAKLAAHKGEVKC